MNGQDDLLIVYVRTGIYNLVYIYVYFIQLYTIDDILYNVG